MTWKDIKTATLQKMYAISGDITAADESTADYIAAMPYAANEALQLLSTAGRFITKSIKIVHCPVPNLLPKSIGENGAYRHLNTDIVFTAKGALAYSFDASSGAEIDIFIDDKKAETLIALGKSPAEYQSFKGIIDNPQGGNVSLIFKGSYAYMINNVALYAQQFAQAQDIPVFSKYTKYNLKSIASDFYKVMENGIFFESSAADDAYAQTENFFLEGAGTLVIPQEKIGEYSVYYYAYPRMITSTTPDDYELELEPNVAVLLPLYMASQLYKDDDNAVAVAYRNEFELARESLSDYCYAPASEQFTSESGWV